MGMAASQARYLALVARKSNCEYEGQQINQSRLALSNQSADLFNQMMGLQVPTTPSKSDYTYITYTFTDGDNTFQLDKWNQLSEWDNSGYNYAVTYHYNKTENVGFQKYKYDPQIKFSLIAPSSKVDPAIEIAKIQVALNDLDALYKTAKEKEQTKNEAIAAASVKTTYRDINTITQATSVLNDDGTYTVNDEGQSPATRYTYTPYQNLDSATKAKIENLLSTLNSDDYNSVFSDSDLGENYENVYYSNGTITFKKDLAALAIEGATPTALPIYHLEGEYQEGAAYQSMQAMINKVTEAKLEYQTAKLAYDKATENVYQIYNIPETIGNLDLVPISTADMDDNTAAQITKIIESMKEAGIENTLTSCFNTLDGTYNAKTYTGGLYKFDQASSTYYVTYYDLYNSIINGSGVNNIDAQSRIPYYGTQDQEVEKTETSRALIEKDKSGRFTSIKFEDNSLVYELKAVQETDEVAYEDAMNEANYQKALYDQMVQEINAKTSLIQIQDKNLELRLKQLDTEQNALNTEIDAVSKVVKDNIEKSFKTFGG